MDGKDRTTRVSVFTPSPLLTLTIEARPDGQEAVHVHPGGQGPWVATMLSVLETESVLCGPFGGETGRVLETLLQRDRTELRSVHIAGGNGCYVEDRRSGTLACVADVAAAPLDRHEQDNLHNDMLAAALDSDVTVLTGPATSTVVDPDMYRRLAADLAALDVSVVADLSGAALSAVLESGVCVLKVAHDDLVVDGRAESDDVRDLARALEALGEHVSGTVVLTRGADPALACIAGRILEVTVPALQPLHHRGAGDSMTAGIAAALSRRYDLEEALRLGAAAGVVNVTRHGLATGDRDTITRISRRVTVEPWKAEQPEEARGA